MLMSLLGLSLLLDACPTLMACHVLPHLNFMRGPGSPFVLHIRMAPHMMPVSAWWNVHPFLALIASPVPFPPVAPESLDFQNAATREAFTAFLHIRIARGFALFEGRVAIFGPGSSLVFASGQETPTAERLAQDLSVFLLRAFGPGQIAFTRLHLANCALFVYRPASLRSELSLCLHSLGEGYVLRVVPTADLRTIQEPIFLFPGIDNPAAQVSGSAVPGEAAQDPASQEHDTAPYPAAASGEAALPGAASSSANAAHGPGTSLAQISFGRSQPRTPSPRCRHPARLVACGAETVAEPS